MKPDPRAPIKAMLEVMVEAALAGHDLTPFERLHTGGYEAGCRRCRTTVWISESGLIYSLLPDRCAPRRP